MGIFFEAFFFFSLGCVLALITAEAKEKYDRRFEEWRKNRKDKN